MTMNDTWGYKSYDNNWKSSTEIIRNLVDIASKGGNYLLNVGPTRLGEIPGPSVERLNAVGTWMHQNSRAIYATTASPFKRLSWGRCTKVVSATGATLYLHVFDWPKDGQLLVPGLRNQTLGASLMAGGAKLKSKNTPEGVLISVSAKAPDAVSSTITLKVKGALQIEQPVLTQSADGSLTLKPGDAILHGDTIQTQGQGDGENIGWWTNPSDWIEWQFKAVKTGSYNLRVEVSSVGTSELKVTVDGQSQSIPIPNTGDYNTFREVDLGTYDIKRSGQVSVSVRAVAGAWHPVNVKGVRFISH